MTANLVNACSALESERMLELYLRHVADALDLASVAWMAAYRGEFSRRYWKTELLGGWKSMDLIRQASPELGPEATMRHFRITQRLGLDILTEHAIKRAGRTRVHRLADTGGGEKERARLDYLALNRIGDRMLGVFTVDKQSESYVVADRAPGKPRFTLEDERTLLQLLVDFPRIHYWLLLERGLVTRCKSPFSPKEREVVKLILEGAAESDMLASTGLKASALRTAIGEVFKNFGVSDRASLMLLWLEAVPTGSLEMLPDMAKGDRT